MLFSEKPLPQAAIFNFCGKEENAMAAETT